MILLSGLAYKLRVVAAKLLIMVRTNAILNSEFVNV